VQLATDESGRVERVQAALSALGEQPQILISDGSTHTAQMAADAAGCELGQIVKTLVVYVAGSPMLVLVCGDRRLDDRLLAARFGVGRKQVKLASAEQVLELTGYDVGGVSPYGLPQPLEVLIDQEMRRFESVWLAAGSARAIFPMNLQRLSDQVRGEFAEVSS
jgi:prolyl-tRNA editing enzyme YbaK/EbsC (Cys-tRNA(Pro) deacylase)